MRGKNFLAGFLCVVMVFSLIPSTVYATEIENINGTAVEEHEHDFETKEPMLNEDGSKLIYSCAIEGCEATYEEDYVSDTPAVVEIKASTDSSQGSTETMQIVNTQDEISAVLTAGGQIRLGQNIDLTQLLEIPQGVTVVIDLDGYSLNQTGTYEWSDDWGSGTSYYNAINNYGDLTIKDSKGGGSITGRIYNGINQDSSPAILLIENGTIIGDAFGKCPIWNDGSAVIKNATAKTDVGDYAVQNYGTMEIEDGQYSSEYSPLYNYNGTLTINGGNYVGPYLGVENDEEGVLIINGGDFKGDRYDVYHSSYAQSLVVNTNQLSGNIYLGKNFSFNQENVFDSITIYGDTNLQNVTTNSLKLTGTITQGTYDNVTSCTANFPSSSTAVVNLKDATIGTGTQRMNIDGGTFNGTINSVKGTNINVSGGLFTASVYEKLSQSSGVKTAQGKNWSDNLDGTYSIKEVGMVNVSIKPTENGKLSVISYKVGISAGSATGSLDDKSLTKGGRIIFSTTATANENYVFSGWYTNPEGNGTAVSTSSTLENFEYVVNEDTTLYAVFKPNDEYQKVVDDAKRWLEKGTYEINNISDMYSFAYAVNYLNEDFSNKTVTLKTDLDYSGHSLFMPVGGSTQFKGTFDGENHTISNINYTDNSAESKVGIFGYNTGTIKNLNVTNCSFVGSDAGGIAAWSEGTIENCTVSQSTLNGSYRYTGGIVGHTYQLTLKNVTATNNTLSGWKVGGIVGYGDTVSADGVTTSNNTLGDSKIYGEFCGHLNAGDSLLVNGNIDAQDQTLIGSNYSGQDGKLTITSDSDTDSTIKVSSISGEMTTNKTYVIESGKFVMDSVLPANQSEFNGTVTVNGGTYTDSQDAPLEDVKQYLPENKVTDDTGTVIDVAAQIGNTKFVYLKDAVTAAQTNDTIVLLSSVTEAQGLVIDSTKNFTLDLNGKELSVTTGNAIVINGGKLTIQDSTVAKLPVISEDYQEVTYESGKISANATCIAVVNGGSVTIESGTIESTGNCGIYAGNSQDGSSGTIVINGGYIQAQEYGVGIINSESELTVNGGVIVSKDNTGIGGNGTVGQGGTTINISNGTIIGHIQTSGYIACGIYHPQQGTLNITGGTIYADGGVGVLMRGGKLDMTGGQIISSGTSSGKVGDSSIISDCYGILLDGAAGYYDVTNSIVSISENAVVKATGDRTPALMVTDKNGITGEMSISGGTFSSMVPEEYCAEGFVPTVEQDAEGNYTVITGPQMYGYTLTLDGTIGVNYYVDMSNVPESDRDKYSMRFTVNDVVIDVPYDSNEYRVSGGKTYYRFTCSVAAKQMTDTIIGQIMKDGSPISKEYKYSVQTYCKNILSKENVAEKTKVLLNAMLTFGGYAQQYFDYNVGKLANDGINVNISSVSQENLSAYKSNYIGELAGLSLNLTLSLDSDTVIRMYITEKSGSQVEDYIFAVSGVNKTPIQCDSNDKGDYYLDISNVAAQHLDNQFNITVTDSENNVYTVSYSALSYACNMLGSSNEKLVNVLKAMYLYNQAANEYFK